MKVLIIPTWYPNGADKLMGAYHKEYTEALNEYGIDADMLFIDRQRLSKPIKYIFMKKSSIDYEKNYKVYITKMLNFGSINFDLQQKLYYKKLKKAFKKYIKVNGKPDILHAMVTVPAGYATCLLGEEYNIPVVVTEHCGNNERFFNGIFKKYGNYVLQHSVYSTVSNYMKDVVLKYSDECYVLPNLVHTNVFENDEKLKKLNKQFNLVSVCALREGKKIDNIFLAMKKAQKNTKIKLHLDVVGDGYEEKYYKDRARELKMGDTVSFLGRKNKQEISEILKQEHALVIASELESFAIPGIEAMSAGLPVISTKCLGPEEYINKDNGILCELNDVDSLANSILEMIDKYDKYDADLIRKSINKYSKTSILKEAEIIYQLALKRK